MIKTHGYAARSATSGLAPFDYEHRDPGPKDVCVTIDFCGICHSDIHQARNEWGTSIYPMVPGHEIIGHVSAIGAEVTKFKVGDLAGVGVAVQTCMRCENCLAGEEPYCEKGMVATYNSKDYDGNDTFGGYGDNIVANEHYVYSISPKLDPAATAPLLCAGITTYSPLRHWKIDDTKKVGVIGLGGLGHMALKFAHAFGAHVVQFTTSENKIVDAKKLGADEVVISKDADAMQKHVNSLDFILDCVSAQHDINAYLKLLRRDATICMVGLPDKPICVEPFDIGTNRRSFAGSFIGGMAQTQEMLDYCAEKSIVSDIEMTSFDNLNEVYERVIKGDVKYRFVLDHKTLKSKQEV
jgi:alcohol dehydrogenase (NADP+)